MILVIGSSADAVYPKLIFSLRESGHPFAVVDEDHPSHYSVYSEEYNGQAIFRIKGDGCYGKNPVRSIFVRHAVARSLNIQHLKQMGILQADLNRMLLFTGCPIINPPANAYSNYAKPYQLGLLVQAGFDIPKTLVTNIPDEARKFFEECEGSVIFKGVSNMITLAQVLEPEKFERIDLLPNCPTLFQEYIAGVDYRVHVIGDEVFVTRLIASNEDYRRSAFIEDEEIIVEPANLPSRIIDRCICFTKQLGLIVSGIDFKESANGRLVALELNPYPQFTFYEGRSGQPITKAVINYLIQYQVKDSNVLV